MRSRTFHPRGHALASKSGDRTRDLLLDAAGEVFAVKGYDGATSREICELAGVNSAAVNYHFGGIEALYAATLLEAHRRLVGIERLTEIVESHDAAEAKLCAFLQLMVQRLVPPAQKSWELRLIGREIASPSPARELLMEVEAQPKISLLRALIGELIGAPPDSPIVGRALFTIAAPCLFLACADPTVLRTILPALADPEAEVEPLTHHLQRFILAGLAAIADPRHPEY